MRYVITNDYLLVEKGSEIFFQFIFRTYLYYAIYKSYEDDFMNNNLSFGYR